MERERERDRERRVRVRGGGGGDVLIWYSANVLSDSRIQSSLSVLMAVSDVCSIHNVHTHTLNNRYDHNIKKETSPSVHAYFTQ